MGGLACVGYWGLTESGTVVQAVLLHHDNGNMMFNIMLIPMALQTSPGPPEEVVYEQLHP